MNRRSLLPLAVGFGLLLALAVMVILQFVPPANAPATATPPSTSSAFVSPLATPTEALHPPNFITPGADRRPQDAVTPSPAEGVTVELVVADGVTRQATYWSPAASERVAAVVLLHGQGSNRGEWTPLAQQLQAAGFAALAVDWQGLGDSGSTPEATAEVAAALDWLARLAIVERERIGIVAVGESAASALRAAATNPDVRAVALLSPQMDASAETIPTTGKPLFLMASSGDTDSADTARALDALAQGPRELRIVDGSARGTDLLAADDELAVTLVRWLDAALALPAN